MNQDKDGDEYEDGDEHEDEREYEDGNGYEREPSRTFNFSDYKEREKQRKRDAFERKQTREKNFRDYFSKKSDKSYKSNAPRSGDKYRYAREERERQERERKEQRKSRKYNDSYRFPSEPQGIESFHDIKALGEPEQDAEKWYNRFQIMSNNHSPINSLERAKILFNIKNDEPLSGEVRRNLALLVHPDRCKHSSATDFCQMYNAAIEILRNNNLAGGRKHHRKTNKRHRKTNKRHRKTHKRYKSRKNYR